jgi:hypothetical protein
VALGSNLNSASIEHILAKLLNLRLVDTKHGYLAWLSYLSEILK